jgi:hypothetical protein
MKILSFDEDLFRDYQFARRITTQPLMACSSKVKYEQTHFLRLQMTFGATERFKWSI